MYHSVLPTAVKTTIKLQGTSHNDTFHAKSRDLDTVCLSFTLDRSYIRLTEQEFTRLPADVSTRYLKDTQKQWKK